MATECCSFWVPTFGPFGQLPGEQDISQLALCVGSDRVIVLLPFQVIKLDFAKDMS